MISRTIFALTVGTWVPLRSMVFFDNEHQGTPLKIVALMLIVEENH